MKVGLVSESPADDAAIQILLEAISGQQIEPIGRARIRAGGWPSMLQAIQVEYTRLCYHTDAQAIIAVADSDDSAIHEIAHDRSHSDFENCRFCLLSERIRHTRSRLRPRPDGHQVYSAVGLAVPALRGLAFVWVRSPLCRGKLPTRTPSREIPGATSPKTEATALWNHKPAFATRDRDSHQRSQTPRLQSLTA